MTNQEIEKLIEKLEKYKAYLNDGHKKPEWRIDEVQCFIKVMSKRIENGN